MVEENILKNKRILVTGATGLLGSWLVKDLIGLGAQTVCLVRDYVPQSIFFLEHLDSRVSVIRGNLEDFYTITRVISEYRPELIFHLGAQTIVTTALQAPTATFKQNIEGTWNLLEATRLHGNSVRGIVVASSDKAYGASGKLPYMEDTPLVGRYPYDVSKSCVDLISQSYFHTYGLPISIVRCGNIFGGGDLNYDRVIPGTVLSLYKNEAPIIRSDGHYIRDYLYVLDAADAYLRVGKCLLNKEHAGEAFNFSYELRLEVLDIVNKITAIMHKKDITPTILNQASNEVREQWLSCQKAKETLKWSPKFSFDEGLRQTIEWYTAFFQDQPS